MHWQVTIVTLQNIDHTPFAERSQRMPMRNPPHPGQLVRYECLEPLSLSVTEGAKVLGVSRQALNNLVNGRSGISPEMAVRLTKAFGGSAAVWLGMQLDYDLAQLSRKRIEKTVKRVWPPKASRAA
jgi:addiction module HigA family antidote